METKIIVTPNGCLEAATTSRGTDAFDGFCGNVTFRLFDRAGNNSGIYSMGRVINGVWALEFGQRSEWTRLRSDRQEIMILTDDISQTNSAAIAHLGLANEWRIY